jgi:hypothetical protein
LDEANTPGVANLPASEVLELAYLIHLAKFQDNLIDHAESKEILLKKKSTPF